MSIVDDKEICDICGNEIERRGGESSVMHVTENLNYHKTCHDNAETLAYGFIKRFLWDMCYMLNKDKKELTVENLMWYSNNEVDLPHNRKRE